MIVVSKYLVPRAYKGLTLFPFIFLKCKSFIKDDQLIHHERIHLRQQLELLVLPFYILYGLEFCIGFVRYRNWQEAYRNISFEREAYHYEGDFSYLKTRKFWQFLRYLRSDGISA